MTGEVCAVLKRKSPMQTIEAFTVTMPFGYSGVASVLSSGQLRVESGDGSRVAFLQTTQQELMAATQSIAANAVSTGVAGCFDA